jgi:hypothetical protein
MIAAALRVGRDFGGVASMICHTHSAQTAP